MNKAYGGNFFMNNKQVRGIMAGTQREVAAAVGCSVNYIRTMWAATGNEKELSVCNSAPGVLFFESARGVYERAVKSSPDCPALIIVV